MQKPLYKIGLVLDATEEVIAVPERTWTKARVKAVFPDGISADISP